MGLITVYQAMFLATVAAVFIAAAREAKRSRPVTAEAESTQIPAQAPAVAPARYFQTREEAPSDPAVDRIRFLDALRSDGLITGPEYDAIRRRIKDWRLDPNSSRPKTVN